MPSSTDKPLAIVKLGGSHALGGRLRAWLDAIAAHAGRIVLVPGGGPFADVVRRTQSQIGFDERAAHEMAMVAMSQFGRALCSLREGFALAASMDALDTALARGLTPVWSPERMALAARLLPSWDVTSDTLAAWLAGRMGAERVILVKHEAAEASASDLVARGIIDPLFPAYLAASGALGFLAADDAFETLSAGLDNDAFAAIRLDA